MMNQRSFLRNKLEDRSYVTPIRVGMYDRNIGVNVNNQRFVDKSRERKQYIVPVDVPSELNWMDWRIFDEKI